MANVIEWKHFKFPGYSINENYQIVMKTGKPSTATGSIKMTDDQGIAHSIKILDLVI